MAKRSRVKTYRIVGSIKYKGTTIGPGEEIPSALSISDIESYVRQCKIRETDPQTGLNIEPRSSSEVEISKDQVSSFFSKPGPFIAQHLD